MKKVKIIFGCLFIMVIVFASCTTRAVVATRPPAPVVTRPAPPSSKYVWVDGEYIRNNRNVYVYRPGYYAIPPRGKVVYKSGYWVKRGNGYYWRSGRW